MQTPADSTSRSAGRSTPADARRRRGCPGRWRRTRTAAARRRDQQHDGGQPVHDQRDAQRTHARTSRRSLTRGPSARPGEVDRRDRDDGVRTPTETARCAVGRPASTSAARGARTAAAGPAAAGGSATSPVPGFTPELSDPAPLICAGAVRPARSSSVSGSARSRWCRARPRRRAPRAPGGVRTARVLGVLASPPRPRAVRATGGQREHERRDAQRDDDRGEDHALRQRIGRRGLRRCARRSGGLPRRAARGDHQQVDGVAEHEQQPQQHSGEAAFEQQVDPRGGEQRDQTSSSQEVVTRAPPRPWWPGTRPPERRPRRPGCAARRAPGRRRSGRRRGRRTARSRA